MTASLKITCECRSAIGKNFIQQVLLHFDDVRAQPTEILINTPEKIFQRGDEWRVEFTLVRRGVGNGSHAGLAKKR